MASVELSRVSKRYSNFVAVHGVDLKIEDGEFIIFLGPSGCGKSTTLRMIAGLEEISGGTVHIGGRDVTHLEPKDRNIAMVFQNYALYPHKTIYENMAFGLRMRRTDEAEIGRRVQEAARMLDLVPLLERKPGQLSGGQMQRVALGRALVREPDVFLLDEPLSNLDAKLRVKMREEIALLHRKVGTSMIYVTHDQVEAMTLANRIVIMKDGHVQQVGAPLEIYDRPANPFVAGFIGSPEMNLFDGIAHGNTVRAGNLTVNIDRALSVSEGSELVVGIRPEHLQVSDGVDALNFNVEFVEQLGAQTLCVGNVNGVRMRLLTDREDKLKSGSMVPVYVPPGRLHLFQKSTGARLSEGQRQTSLQQRSVA